MRPDKSIPTISEAALARLRDIESQLADIDRFVVERPEEPLNIDRINSAKAFATEARNLLSTSSLPNPAERHAVYAALLSAQVEIDYTLYPQVDPTEGWVRLQTPASGPALISGRVVDTQLIRFYFASHFQGAITELDYKPRKVNLSNAVDDSKPSGEPILLPSSFEFFVSADESTIWAELEKVQSALTTFAQTSEPKIMRQTPDSLGLRFNTKFSIGALPFALVRDYLFKAGIGAHEPNYNTGFSIEYWLETATPINGFIVSEWNLSLASSSAELLRARPLASFGGEAEHTFDLEQEHKLDHTAVPGGIYGVRIIDSADNFVFDIRFSKFLFGIQLKPIFCATEPAPTIQGLRLRFLMRAKDISSDSKSNTLFFSIR